MTYNVDNIEIKPLLDVGRLETDMGDIESDNLEEWEVMMPHQVRGTEIMMSAMDTTNGDVRVLAEIDITDYLYAQAVED